MVNVVRQRTDKIKLAVKSAMLMHHAFPINISQRVPSGVEQRWK